jgi:hypothetical protein
MAPSSRVARRAVFDRVDPALGAQFGVMIDEHLLDLDSRAGKAPGATVIRCTGAGGRSSS